MLTASAGDVKAQPIGRPGNKPRSGSVEMEKACSVKVMERTHEEATEPLLYTPEEKPPSYNEISGKLYYLCRIYWRIGSRRSTRNDKSGHFRD
jgi:hypothetical protein